MKTNIAIPPKTTVIEMDHGADERFPETATQISPFHLQKILVPVDFSDCSQKALAYALPLARQFQAQLILLHVIPLPGCRRRFDRADYLEVHQEAVRRLTVLAETADSLEFPLQIEVRHGVESAEIVSAAADLKVNLIIMSTHGRTGRAHSFVGSVSESTVQLAPCPVLVVREHENGFVRHQTILQPACPIAA